MTISLTSYRRFPSGAREASVRDIFFEVTHTTVSPRSFAYKAASTGTVLMPVLEEMRIVSPARSPALPSTSAALPGMRSICVLVIAPV